MAGPRNHSRRLVTKEQVIGLLRTVIDSRDISALVQKTSEDLGKKSLEDARIKLMVLDNIYGHMQGCAFMGMNAINHHYYLGLKQEYEELIKNQS